MISIKKKLIKTYIKTRNFVILYRNRLRYRFRIEIRGKRLFLVVPDKQEGKIKLILRILLVVGIFSSLVSFPFVLYGIFFAILLVLLEQFFEKAVLTSGAFFIQPIPDWNDYEKAKWEGISFGGVSSANGNEKNLAIDKRFPYSIGMLFTGDLDSIRRLFTVIHQWNYFRDEDKDNNINLSFIIEEGEEEYTIYIYPSPDRKGLKSFFKEAEKENEETGKETEKFVMQIIFAKRFKLKGSSFEQFKDIYKDGEAYYFFAHFMKPELSELKPAFFSGKSEDIFKSSKGTSVILKRNIKIKNRRELTKKDLEYGHGRNVMEKL